MGRSTADKGSKGWLGAWVVQETARRQACLPKNE